MRDVWRGNIGKLEGKTKGIKGEKKEILGGKTEGLKGAFRRGVANKNSSPGRWAQIRGMGSLNNLTNQQPGGVA